MAIFSPCLCINPTVIAGSACPIICNTLSISDAFELRADKLISVDHR